MLPPGISFNAVSPKAIEVSKHARLPKAFWAWDDAGVQQDRLLPHTPSTNLLYGLHEALDMILGEGLDHVFCTTPAACARLPCCCQRLGP